MRRSRVLSMASRKRKRLSFSEKYAILAELDSGVLRGLTQGIDWTEFVDVDQCVAVGPSSEGDSANDILDTVFPETREPLDESTSSDEENVEEIDTSPPPSFKEAMTSIGSALDYLRTIQGSEAECLKLANIHEYMVDQYFKKPKATAH